ncbi:DUF3696 domain-containing protein [Verrucomicrobiaceae bacterium N1E253]|uniref:DUF3696 domain-containing protein n=1 Tax=Oceaniferula marina TaxID=2748318 RepID=A0A851GD26_9BACT|nr:DUF3696 domain-containing protein [Oceaniferula marina]NWK55658.1 DUF3696 domain-containing protein [Oceaniferula marina]
MITKINISNFKCLEDLSLPFSSMTVLAGMNGMGKSTLMQSLLILHQSVTDVLHPMSHLECKGRWADLGVESDVLCEGGDSETIKFNLTSDDGEMYPGGYRFTLNKETREFIAEEDYSGSLDRRHGIFTDQFHYLRAERLGPRVSFPVSNEDVRMHRQLGRDGEYTPYFLEVFGSEKVRNTSLYHPEASSPSLIHQTEAWLGEISPGTRLYTNSHEDLDLVSLQYAFTGGAGETNHYRATNVGFGISYILPIIVAALSAPEGSMLLIENPEAHLHPRGQRKIAELLAKASKMGVQIIVETHSDHFLNGLRLSVHSGAVEPEEVALHFFEREHTEYAIRAKVSSPKIDENGRIDFWPDGFFDESEKALRELLRPKTKHD